VVTKIVLNLEDITYIDSAGVGELVQAYNTARATGGLLRLTGLTKGRLQDVLQIIKLLTVFEVFPTEQAAVASFGSGPGYWCQCDTHGSYIGPPPWNSPRIAFVKLS
jgi:anti-anti-sigma regulatory factor